MVVPRDTEISLSDLNQSSPTKNYGRAWFDPCKENRLLKYTSHDMRVQDGDLLLLQDKNEPLKQLTPADMKSMDIVALASSPIEYNEEWNSGYVCYPANNNPKVSFYDGNHNHSYNTSVQTVNSVTTSHSNGIRITTHRERERLKENNNSVEISNNSNKVNESYTANQMEVNNTNGTSTDVEFEKQGGLAIFDDII